MHEAASFQSCLQGDGACRQVGHVVFQGILLMEERVLLLSGVSPLLPLACHQKTGWSQPRHLPASSLCWQFSAGLCLMCIPHLYSYTSRKFHRGRGFHQLYKITPEPTQPDPGMMLPMAVAVTVGNPSQCTITKRWHSCRSTSVLNAEWMYTCKAVSVVI